MLRSFSLTLVLDKLVPQGLSLFDYTFDQTPVSARNLHNLMVSPRDNHLRVDNLDFDDLQLRNSIKTNTTLLNIIREYNRYDQLLYEEAKRIFDATFDGMPQ